MAQRQAWWSLTQTLERLGKSRVETLTGWASLVLIGVLLPTLITVALQTGAYKPSQYFSSTYQGIEDYSTQKNVVVLMLDSVDGNDFSRCIGTPTSRIVVRNLLPYLVSVIMLRMALTIPAAIGSEVFITYIGLGLSVEVPSLGNLINDGRKVMMQAGLRYQLLYPTIILSFVTIAFYLIGNAFSDAADPKNHLQ